MGIAEMENGMRTMDAQEINEIEERVIDITENVRAYGTVHEIATKYMPKMIAEIRRLQHTEGETNAIQN